MPRCCGGAGCNCTVVAGLHIQVTGDGSGQLPYTIIGDVSLGTGAGTQIQLALAGQGTEASPWVLTADYAATATLDAIPNVNTSGKTNGQVLSWDSALGKWKAVNPTTAAPGASVVGTSLSGDGSAGSPLVVRHDSARFTGTVTGGIGLTDAGVNSLVRHFVDATARAAASPAPVKNTLSMLDSKPGQVEYYDDTSSTWKSVRMPLDISGQLLAMSGAYSSQPVTLMVRHRSVTTDASGMFEAFSVADLSGKAGVVAAWWQRTGSTGPAFTVSMVPAGTKINAVAYNSADGAVLANQAITGQVVGWIY